jgi:glutamyl-tRNA synthetase
MKTRVRFAPSPTGYLHIGGARTALFNWLYAKHTGGTFVLRIEDTDAARNSQEAVDVILNGLRWLGLDWDEGPLTGDATGASKGDRGPYFQSQRKANYLARVEALLSRGLAYEHEGAVKFKMTREPILIPDLVVGDVLRPLTDREELDPDFVILRSDGQPVFHLVNVIDDLEMDITHVIRGEDHLSNTAKHIALFNAFGVKPPHYAHIPLILNGDGSKMSKRDKGASLTSYLDDGFLPEAVINYLCLLGWSPKDNLEKISLADVIERFDLPQILRHNARFDYEKLLWLQGEYAREITDDRFYELAVHAFAKAGIETNNFPLPYVKAALDTCKGKFKLFNELPAYAGFYFRDEIVYNADEAKKAFVPENKPRLEKLRDALAALNPFNAATIETALKETAKQLGVKAGVLIHPTRLACTGNPHGPSLYHLIEVLGKDKVIRRLGRATVHPEFSHIPLKFIMWVGILVRDTHGLPDAEYVASELKARELFRKLQHTSIEREAKPILQQDQEGAFSLLFACIDFASSHGTPISLGDISVAKIEDTEWDRDGITNVSINLFLRKAIDGMKQ